MLLFQIRDHTLHSGLQRYQLEGEDSDDGKDCVAEDPGLPGLGKHTVVLGFRPGFRIYCCK